MISDDEYGVQTELYCATYEKNPGIIMSNRTCCCAALVLLVFLSACSPQAEPGTSHSFRVFSEDGITVAETLGGPRYEGELFEYVPVLTLEPGDTEETMLFNPTSFIADSEGWFYVNDAGNGDIVVFDPEGRFHKRFGRKGAGPGEFQRAQFLCTVDDMLYIYDSSQRRTTRFRRSGEVVDMVSTQRNILSPRVTALIPLPGTERLLLSSGDDAPMPGRPTGEGNSWCNVLRLTASGDTVWSWSSEPIRTSYPISMTIGGNTFTSSLPYPFAPYPQAYFVPDFGVVAVASFTPQLDIISLDGEIHRRIRIDMGDQSVTEVDRQTFLDLFDKMLEEAPQDQTREIMEDQRKGLQFGEKKAPWTGLKFDDRGYLYLAPMISSEATPDSTETIGYLVISPEGEYLGMTKRPMGRTEVSGGRLLVNYSDSETGEFTLTVYDIRPKVKGLKYPN